MTDLFQNFPQEKIESICSKLQANPTSMGMGILVIIAICIICACCLSSSSAAAGAYYYTSEQKKNTEST